MRYLPNGKKSESDENQWLSVSDLMAGLMMVFLCISVAMIHSVMAEREKITAIAVSYQENQLSIYRALHNAFKTDLERWGANISDDTLTIVFQAPDAMFETGKTELSDRYKKILAEFFPRYMTVLQPFTDSIEEIRLEGHTSSGWGATDPSGNAYYKNLKLSQERTRSVLRFVSTLTNVSEYKHWMKSHMAAVGYSSSRPILNARGEEDPVRSKRVAFRVITNADLEIKNILEGLIEKDAKAAL
jgi:outer membrane protein OmpA-like peptidoglycan-associated protein